MREELRTAENPGRVVRPELLSYRPWRGHLEADAPPGARSGPAVVLGWLWEPVRSVRVSWPIARTSLELIFRRKLFWGMYVLAMLVFLLFFFGQYLMAWASTQVGQREVRVGGLGMANPQDLVNHLRSALKMDGSAETYRNFFSFESHMVMIVLALTGSVLIGNDLRFGSLPFYLSKPVSRRHYLLGKALAVAVFVNLLTTLPALVLFIEIGFLEPGGSADRGWSVPVLAPVLLLAILGWWIRTGRVSVGWLVTAVVAAAGELAFLLTGNYFADRYYLALGIVGYGAILTVSLTLILLATASWVQKTVPLIMTWASLFVFCRVLSAGMVDGLHFDPRWRLLDLWNSCSLLGSCCLRLEPAKVIPLPQPEWYEAALILGSVCVSCLIYLILRIRAVEVVK